MLGMLCKQIVRKPLISHVPLPYKFPSPLSISLHGSVTQACPSTGTTSVCPDNITPPSTAGPIRQCKEAFVPLSLGTKVVVISNDSIWFLIQLIISKLDSPPKTGKDTNFSKICIVVILFHLYDFV